MMRIRGVTVTIIGDGAGMAVEEMAGVVVVVAVAVGEMQSVVETSTTTTST